MNPKKLEIMSKRFNPSNLHKAFRLALCLFVMPGAYAPVMAQDVVDEEAIAEADSIALAKRRIAKKPEKQYEMKAVAGTITDGATGLPMGGVRVQALQLPRYSTLTEEDGTYKLEVPVFCHALLIDAPDYNLLQLAINGETGQDARL